MSASYLDSICWPVDPVRAPLLSVAESLISSDQPLSFVGPAAGLEILGINRAVWYRAVRRGGFTDKQADHIAAVLGEHPSYFWPEWFDIDHAELERFVARQQKRVAA